MPLRFFPFARARQQYRPRCNRCAPNGVERQVEKSGQSIERIGVPEQHREGSGKLRNDRGRRRNRDPLRERSASGKRDEGHDDRRGQLKDGTQRSELTKCGELVAEKSRAGEQNLGAPSAEDRHSPGKPARSLYLPLAHCTHLLGENSGVMRVSDFYSLSGISRVELPVLGKRERLPTVGLEQTPADDHPVSSKGTIHRRRV